MDLSSISLSWLSYETFTNESLIDSEFSNSLTKFSLGAQFSVPWISARYFETHTEEYQLMALWDAMDKFRVLCELLLLPVTLLVLCQQGRVRSMFFV